MSVMLMAEPLSWGLHLLLLRRERWALLERWAGIAKVTQSSPWPALLTFWVPLEQQNNDLSIIGTLPFFPIWLKNLSFVSILNTYPLPADFVHMLSFLWCIGLALACLCKYLWDGSRHRVPRWLLKFLSEMEMLGHFGGAYNKCDLVEECDFISFFCLVRLGQPCWSGSFGCDSYVTKVVVLFEEALLLSKCVPWRSKTKPAMVLGAKTLFRYSAETINVFWLLQSWVV